MSEFHGKCSGVGCPRPARHEVISRGRQIWACDEHKGHLPAWVRDMEATVKDYASELAEKWTHDLIYTPGVEHRVFIEGAIREALGKAAEVADDVSFSCDGSCEAPADCADAIRALGAKR